ncbi:hypothetical protein BC827DRAFT_1139398 [Russula dissimulans]|nr:hypothetical protein BC827DRAFT_1139398 [Russula dissimulans]
MSAYGTITVTANAPVGLLPPITWDLLPRPAAPGKPVSPFRHLAMHHLRLDTARALPGLLEYTHHIFAAEIEEGRSYPQEEGYRLILYQAYTRAAFEAYFWAGDVIIAIGMVGDGVSVDGRDRGGDVEASRGGRSWEDVLVGFYYVKPNYPGRSSHICNAGFVVPPAHRQYGYGMTLGKSYLHYAPALGYRASVFNLVYATNTGSLRIWDSLGFTRVGLIPRAGRLRRADGSGDEWVDAVIYYRSFMDEEEWTRSIV